MNKEIKLVINTIKNLENEIRNKFKARVKGVFGSYARDEQSENSDIDIIVKFFEGASLFDFVGLAEYLEEKLEKKVDILSERAIRQELYEQIMKEVIEV